MYMYAYVNLHGMHYNLGMAYDAECVILCSC